MSVLVCVKRTDSIIFVSIVSVKRSDSFISILLHDIKRVLRCLNFEQAKFLTLINLMNKTVIVLICVKSSKLIISGQNITSAQQPPLCLLLFFVFSSDVLNPHMHKIGPWGPRYYFFGDQFYSKNARMLRFHEILHFHARKHMTSSFYPKWTESTRNFEFCSNLVWVLGTNNWNKIHNFLGIRSKSGKIMITCVF